MPKTKVKVPTPLRGFAGGNAEVEVEGSTVGEVVRALTSAYPDLARHLLTPEGTLRSCVSVFVNQTDVRTLEREATVLREGDVVSIVPAIAGGAPTHGTSLPVLTPGPGAARRSDTFSPEELRRYSRHLLLPEVGVAGQKRLRTAKVLVVGTGGLGAPASLYLAAAGVGEIGLVDFDRVELSNLQRQVLFATPDVGHPKLEAAASRLEGLNPGVRVVRHETRLDSSNALDILRPYDIVLDGTDNFPTRYLVNDASVLLGKPNVYGSIYRFEGQVSVFDARRGPCYRCLYPEPPPPDLVPSCAEAGVLGVLPGLVGVLQATEAVKLLLGVGEPLVGRLLSIDALTTRFTELKIRKDPACPLCGEHPTITELVDYDAFCAGPAPADSAELAPGTSELAPAAAARHLAAGGVTLLDVREPFEWNISRIQGARLIPLGQLSARLSELSPASPVIVYCHTGQRSRRAVDAMRAAGFARAYNLTGGIDRWSREIDPSLPRY